MREQQEEALGALLSSRPHGVWREQVESTKWVWPLSASLVEAGQCVRLDGRHIIAQRTPQTEGNSWRERA